MALFFSNKPDSVTVSQHAQYQGPENEAAKWNSAIIHLITYTCAFPTVTCQNVFCENSQLSTKLIESLQRCTFNCFGKSQLEGQAICIISARVNRQSFFTHFKKKAQLRANIIIYKKNNGHPSSKGTFWIIILIHKVY